MMTLIRRNKAGFRLLNPKTNEKILDLGSSKGWILDYISEKGAIPFGLDIEKQLIFSGKKDNHNRNLILGDARNTPFKKNSIDKVISLDVLEHVYGINNDIKDVNKIINNCHTYLKKRGLLIFSVPYSSIWTFLDLMWWKGIFSGHAHKHFSKSEIKQLLSEFKIEKISIYGGFTTEYMRLMFKLKKTFGSLVPDKYIHYLQIKSEKEFEIEQKQGTNIFVIAKKI